MIQTILLVDFENVPYVDLASIPADYRVLIFVGQARNTVPFEMTQVGQHLGDRLTWIKIDGNGRNNLDFHLAFYLGQLSARHAHARFLILSKDKGFDSVVRHVGKEKVVCSRIESLVGIETITPGKSDSPGSPQADLHFEKAKENLTKLAKIARPTKVKTLSTHLLTLLKRDGAKAKDIVRIVNIFFERNLISETGINLTYHF